MMLAILFVSVSPFSRTLGRGGSMFARVSSIYPVIYPTREGLCGSFFSCANHIHVLPPEIQRMANESEYGSFCSVCTHGNICL
jgi:hypothetical protein